MKRVHATFLFVGVAVMAGAAVGSCSDRHAGGACYYDDSEDADKYLPPPLMDWCDWCANGRDCAVSRLAEEYCPAGECLETFKTCDEVPLDQECQMCPSEELDDKVLAAFEMREREHPVCTDGSARELIDSERGCMYESEDDGVKYCCYTGVFAVESCGS